MNHGIPPEYLWIVRTLPTVLIVIDVGCAIVYGWFGGVRAWRNMGYWLAAAALTYCVTY